MPFPIAAVAAAAAPSLVSGLLGKKNGSKRPIEKPSMFKVGHMVMINDDVFQVALNVRGRSFWKRI